jgi:hypothetical protein
VKHRPRLRERPTSRRDLVVNKPEPRPNVIPLPKPRRLGPDHGPRIVGVMSDSPVNVINAWLDSEGR